VLSNRSALAILWVAAIAFLTLQPETAHAHPGHGPHGLAHGLAHPLLGWDHLLAMLAVGIWAGQRGGRSRWILPSAFVVSMAAGGALALAGISLPGAEAGILASVLVLGSLIAAAVRFPLVASVALVAAFAVFHGHAHGMEMRQSASGAFYGLGFCLSTALLHAAGVGLPALLSRISEERFVRFAGAAIGIAGIALVVA